MLNNTVVLSVIMFLAGIGIPIMAALNGGLGTRLGNPNFAAMLLFLCGLAVTGIFVAASSIPARHELFSTPPHFFLGGLFVAFYVLTVTWIGPKIGIGNAIFLVVLGQLLAAAVIDHFGLFGLPRFSLSFARVGGLGLMALGVFLARRPTIDL